LLGYPWAFPWVSSTWRKATASQGPRFRFVHRFVANLPHHLELVALVAVPSSFEEIISHPEKKRKLSKTFILQNTTIKKKSAKVRSNEKVV